MKTRTRAGKQLSIRLLAILVAVLACSLFVAAPKPTYADTATQLRDQINSFDHGGYGNLEAFLITGRPYVIVTGTVTGATHQLYLNIDSGLTVQWAANYSGSVGVNLIRLTGGGTFEVPTDGYLINNGDGHAIFSMGTNAKVNVSGGTVRAPSNAMGIFSTGANSAVNVSGGAVSAGTAIRIQGTDSTVSVSGGIVSATSTTAIYVDGASGAVTISGGFVFGYGSNISGTEMGTSAICIQSGATPTISDNAVVCAWNKPGETPTYAEGSSTALSVAPAGATATWGSVTVGYMTQGCIRYKNGSNEGLYAIFPGVIVNSPTTTYTITVTAGVGGTAYASVSSAQAGDEITLTAVEDEGYMFKKWDVISGPVVLYGSEFTMPANNVAFKALFEPISGTTMQNVTEQGGAESGEAGQGGAAEEGTTEPGEAEQGGVEPGETGDPTSRTSPGAASTSRDTARAGYSATSDSTATSGNNANGDSDFNKLWILLGALVLVAVGGVIALIIMGRKGNS